MINVAKHFASGQEKLVCEGDKCKYKHALPRGYKLKRDQVIVEEKREQTLEELLALDKAKYTEFDPSKLEGTPVTVERFLEWKIKFKKEMEKNKPQEKKNDKKQTGKEMFTFNPDMEADGETDGGVSIYDIIDNKNKERKEKEDNLANENTEDNENDEDKNVEIDEDLFDSEDIDLLDNELNNLTVNR
ncbi:hypothetical protein RND71_044059 [Anisodus tanguticus]|uniref:ZC3H15/TMA46 family C-terminal domain-containing protein n=1 Tax=Anisodus tanguticus TaxID=243964 RepID=A0AAE1ULT6_9SOLA|nr:hypothetical protein RND71_044059 [Anisodus tanguticus]